MYGMTESSPLSTVSTVRSHLQHLPLSDQYRMKAKAGYAMIGCEVKVVNEHGEEVPRDGKSIGEVIVRSNGVMAGYWKIQKRQWKRFVTAGFIQEIWRLSMHMATSTSLIGKRYYY